MNTQLKKAAINLEDIISGHEKKVPRPNIDHLIKRIMTERRKERKINVVTMILILSVIASAALFFS
jgi:hypothetical protein